MSANPKAENPVLPRVDTEALAAGVVRMCQHRGWSMHWTHRGAYLHLEASELIEAIRGKRGEPVKEAADVLLVLMSITQYLGIPWGDVERQARAKCDEMMVRARYDGEEHDGRQLGELMGTSGDDWGWKRLSRQPPTASPEMSHDPKTNHTEVYR